MWVEYQANRDRDEENDDYGKEESHFKKKKTNLPLNPSPEVKTFLYGILSELKDPLNAQKSKPPQGNFKH